MLAVSVIVVVGYIAALTTGWGEVIIDAVVSIAVLGILGITGWIGWTMLTTPPPAPLEAEIGTPGSSSSSGTTSGSSAMAGKTEEKKKYNHASSRITLSVF